jgi:predicted acyltransferase
VKNNSHLQENPIWQFLAYQLAHVKWTGCSFWDLIQPSFMFMVGVAIPYSHASRKAKGDSEWKIFRHVLVRVLILIFLGVFLSSNYEKATDFTFVNVLTQIGMGYAFVYLLRGKGIYLQSAALLAILGGYWYLFYQHPLSGSNFDFQKVEVSKEERFSGLYAHWTKNANFASDQDLKFLNLFRRSEPFRFHLFGEDWETQAFLRVDPKNPGNPDPFKYNKGGYQTLNFIPSMATMLFGLMAGELLRGRQRPHSKRNILVLAGLLCLGLGLITDYTIWPDNKIYVPSVDASGTGVSLFHLCPIVKRIWTPTWAVFSSGWTFLMLAGFYWIIDILGYRRWAFFLTVVGMNSIAMYCMAQLSKGWVKQTLKIHFGQNIYLGTYGPIVESISILLVLWLVCWWMYRQKIFIRI